VSAQTDALRAQIQRLASARPYASSATFKARYGFPGFARWWFPPAGDSMPYVVIEAAAAGIPMIAAKCRRIPEIFGPAYRRAVCAEYRDRHG